MADEKIGVRLWGSEGGTFVEGEYAVGDSRPDVILHGDTAYVWDQRNGQYREGTLVKTAAKAAAPSPKPELTKNPTEPNEKAIADASGADSARPTTAGDLAGAHEVKPTSTAADVALPKRG